MSMRKKDAPSSEFKTLSAAMGHPSKKGSNSSEVPSLVFHNVLKNTSSGKAKSLKKDPLHINGDHDACTRVTIPSAGKMSAKKRTGFHMPKKG